MVFCVSTFVSSSFYSHLGKSNDSNSSAVVLKRTGHVSTTGHEAQQGHKGCERLSPLNELIKGDLVVFLASVHLLQNVL